MSHERIDQLLGAWEERLKRVDENLLALEAEPTYQMLAGGIDGKRAPLDGITKSKVYPALEALGELFEHRERLTEVLDRAKEVRESISTLTFWNTDEKLAEVESLLHGPSIKLGSKTTPLAQRNLLDPAAKDVAVVPETLLQAMVHAYEAARDAVLLVQKAWAELEPSIERAELEVTDIKRSAASLGVGQGVVGELASVERDLSAMRSKLARDPLGVAGNFDMALAPRIATVRARLDALSGLRSKVDSELARAALVRKQLDDAHAAARRAIAAAPCEFADPVALPVPSEDGALRGLDPWLEKLNATARAGRWQSADVGLARWLEIAEQYLANDASIARTLEALVARRAELAGRLSARRAQAKAIAARGVQVDPSLEPMARQAESLLANRPTPLAHAAQLVEAYESAIILLSRR